MNELSEEAKSQIKTLLDASDVGNFFTHYFSPELKTGSMIFNVDSKWARGRTELVMVTVLISEEDPDYSTYEKRLMKFVEKVSKIPDIYKAFYINSPPVAEKEEIERKFLNLKEELENVYKILSVKKIETEGHLLTFSKLRENPKIELSQDFVKKLSILTDKKKNVFMVFRTRSEEIKLDIIPVKAESVFNLVIIFGEQMTINVLQQISQVFAKFEDKVTLVFTSGICQEADKCVYEVYIDTSQELLNQILESIYKIPGIIAIDVKLLNAST